MICIHAYLLIYIDPQEDIDRKKAHQAKRNVNVQLPDSIEDVVTPWHKYEQ
jgi:hypothetical protein